LGDWFPLRTYFLTSKASPNDQGMTVMVVVIIVIGEAELELHGVGIIAQRFYLGRGFLLRENNQPDKKAKASPITKLICHSHLPTILKD
jgi:hypothetical protein